MFFRKKYIKTYFLVVSTLTITIHLCIAQQIHRFLPDISCSIVDLKFDGKNIKILEFGEIRESRFNGHNNLYKKGTIWKNLWNTLATYHLPIWCIGNKRELEKRKKHVSLETLSSLKKTYIVHTIQDLTQHPIFTKKTQNSPAAHTQHIKKHNGIIVLTNSKIPSHIRNKLAIDHPDFLILSDAIASFVESKKKSMALFDTEELKNFRPQSKLYEKTYTPTLCKQILSDFHHDNLVIKPTSSSMGNGIIIIKRDDLEKTLKLILSPENKIMLKNMTDKSYSYWHRNTNKHFMIENYENSKPIPVNKKLFNGTMRVVFVLTNDNNKIDIAFLGSYWKLPILSIDGKGTLNEKHKSNIKAGVVSSAKVTPEDYKAVKKQLRIVLPKIYQKMLLSKTKRHLS